MLEKVKVISKIEVVESGHVQVRESIRIMENGQVLSESYHRYALAPNDSLEGQPAQVVAIAQAAWTPEIIAAYEAQKAANKP